MLTEDIVCIFPKHYIDLFYIVVKKITVLMNVRIKTSHIEFFISL